MENINRFFKKKRLDITFKMPGFNCLWLLQSAASESSSVNDNDRAGSHNSLTGNFLYIDNSCICLQNEA